MLVLTAVRKRKNLSQYRLAALAQVSQAAIAFIESRATRNPSVEVTLRLGSALGVCPDLLLCDVTDLNAADRKTLGL